MKQGKLFIRPENAGLVLQYSKNPSTWRRKEPDDD
jgi:hypothetical protein